jgi:2-oxoglutarate dehydrogenase E1 component
MQNDPLTYIHWTHLPFLEELYAKYRQDPASLEPSWRGFFLGMDFVKKTGKGEQGDERFFRLLEAYRKQGHIKMICNPLEDNKKEGFNFKDFGFTEKDLTLCSFLGKTLDEWISFLEVSYTKRIGFEVDGASQEVVSWIEKYAENGVKEFSLEEIKKVWEELYQTEVFEKFIHVKYPGQTRFSLEGAETLIPMLQFLLICGANKGVQELFLGMAHRGRLDVLTGVLSKPYADIFEEFEEIPSLQGSGDVKYHKGTHTTLSIGKELTISVVLPSNPSHLESVNPVIQGEVLAKQQLKGDIEAQEKVVAVLLHGDASLSGQGVIYETMQLSQLPGYKTGGTIHIVLNNHIGYTTLPIEGRSTRYCTDIAKTFGAPVLHVNAEDPLSCLEAVAIASELRSLFHIDVFIDLNCYRKYGHNEGDEPSFTQPVQYQKIRGKESICSLFEKKLMQMQVLSQQEIEEKRGAFQAHLQSILMQVKQHPKERACEVFQRKKEREESHCISIEALQKIGEKICKVPEGFNLHPKLSKLLDNRLIMIQKVEEPLVDFAMAEALAFGSVLEEGITVRLSGQDVGRGTFSHRHALWIDQKNANTYIPLSHLKEGAAPFFLHNSPLSEFAVMGFDFGYSLGNPNSLVLWEAQYGDFYNGAQIIVDQYISSCEQKWAHRSNFTLLLPHGYEGKGPEHSSARIERFLQLSAEDNWRVVNCTTASQFFHLLRRQAHIIDKKPLVVFTPKALLRHPACFSSCKQLAEGRFFSCLDDPIQNKEAKRLILCSGKVFYDLLEERKKRNASYIAILRIEELYPFPKEEVKILIEQYSALEDLFFVQEEPKNMGPWYYIERVWREIFPEKMPLQYVGRKESASAATGSYSMHVREYEEFMEAAFE